MATVWLLYLNDKLLKTAAAVAKIGKKDTKEDAKFEKGMVRQAIIDTC